MLSNSEFQVDEYECSPNLGNWWDNSALDGLHSLYDVLTPSRLPLLLPNVRNIMSLSVGVVFPAEISTLNHVFSSESNSKFYLQISPESAAEVTQVFWYIELGCLRWRLRCSSRRKCSPIAQVSQGEHNSRRIHFANYGGSRCPPTRAPINVVNSEGREHTDQNRPLSCCIPTLGWPFSEYICILSQKTKISLLS